ncbi:hypothetical protein ACHAW6_002341 [Cyclotella cf. meneghiniana]
MMVFPALASSMGAAAAVLCFSSVSNMFEMYQTLQQHHQCLAPSTQSSATHDEGMSRASISLAAKARKWKSVSEGLTELRKMPRRELIQLFLQCENTESLELFNHDANQQNAVYDGYLLNNGPILTHVTNFITNRLFGRGRQWLGKVYFEPTGADAIRNGQNRFACKQGERLDCTFNCYIGPSALCRRLPTMQGPSVIINDYAPHNNNLLPSSLVWGGMVDELRIIPMAQSGRKVILLGMGYFKWSGGVWNAAPFCLVART